MRRVFGSIPKVSILERVGRHKETLNKKITLNS